MAELQSIKDMDRVVLLDVPISPSGLSGDSVNTVVSRFREVKKHKGFLVKFLSRRTQGEGLPVTQTRPGPSVKCETQKQGVVSQSPPHQDWGSALHPQQPPKRPDLRTIISKKMKS